MPITFSGLVSTIATTWKSAKALHNWASDAALKKDFEQYLSALERRRVLYAGWEYENIHAVLASLSEILDQTRELRARHNKNHEISKLLGSFINTLQRESDVIRGCNMQTRQGEFMAYKALLKIRSEMAQMLSILCGILDVNPRNTELEQFIMNMALVRAKA
ncbi:MAG: hypothetical protein ACYCZI_00880 [Metallibacterium scheffleri]